MKEAQFYIDLIYLILQLNDDFVSLRIKRGASKPQL